MPRKLPKPETVTAYKEFQRRIEELQKKYHVTAVNNYSLLLFKKAYEGQQDSMDQIVRKAFTGSPHAWNDNQIQRVKAWMIRNNVYHGEDDEGVRIVGGRMIREMNISQKALGKYKFMYDPTKVANWISVEVFGSDPEPVKSDSGDDEE